MSHLVTGSAGFIGGHLMRDYASRQAPVTGLDRRRPASYAQPFMLADVRSPECVEDVFETVVHLAAIGEVMVPFAETIELYGCNVTGTFNVLSSLQTGLFIFASSSSVYGHCGSRSVDPRRDPVSPVGSYGMTKAAGELLCRDWALGGPMRTAVCLRFANVIGGGCRGLIRYIGEHLLRHPAGDVPARLRGAGKLVRDYVPVETVIDAIRRATLRQWDTPAKTLNVSSGIALTNGEIVEILKPEIEAAGLTLNVDWSTAPGSGEALDTLLDPSLTEDVLEVARPSIQAIEESVRQSLRSFIHKRAEVMQCAS